MVSFSSENFGDGTKTFRCFQRLMLLVVVVWLGFVSGAQVNPGFQFRLSRSGLNYGSTVALDILSKSVQQLKVPDMHGSANVRIGKVSYDITNMRVTGFTKPSTNVVINTGSGLTWQLNNAGVSMNGDWHYKFKKGFIRFQDSGSFDGHVSGASVSASVSLGQDATGRPTISSTGCLCNIDSVKIRLHGGASWLYNLFIKYIEKPIRKSLQEQICTLARKAIDENARAELATLPTEIAIGNKWAFDYRLVSGPLFQAEFLDSYHKGEFFAKGDTTEAPYQAAVFPTSASNQMVTVWASDYILNTVGYVLYKRGILKHNLTKNELPADERGVLNTTCSSLKCFGFLVPQAATVYPNASVELEMFASSYPTASISTAGFRGNFAGVINFSARLANGSLAPMFKTKLSVTISLTPSLTNMVLKATVNDLSSTIEVTDSKIGKLPDAVLNAAFSLISKIFIVPKLNAIGEKGLPIPSIKDVLFTNTKLAMDNHCVRITTDVQYSPSEALRYEAGNV